MKANPVRTIAPAPAVSQRSLVPWSFPASAVPPGTVGVGMMRANVASRARRTKPSKVGYISIMRTNIGLKVSFTCEIKAEEITVNGFIL